MKGPSEPTGTASYMDTESQLDLWTGWRVKFNAACWINKDNPNFVDPFVDRGASSC